MEQTNREDAIQYAIWLNFKYRLGNTSFGVIQIDQEEYRIIDKVDAKEAELNFTEHLPDNYEMLTFDQIELIRESNVLPHFENLKEFTSNLDIELLMFLTLKNFPMEKWLRYELASRGYDENLIYIGDRQARKKWINE